MKEITDFITKNSWFEFDDCDEQGGDIYFSTRNHGNVYDEQPGIEDYKEAKRIATLVEEKYDNVSTDIETVDEWTMLNVKVL